MTSIPNNNANTTTGTYQTVSSHKPEKGIF
jgi:hypothetical protein